MWRALTTNVVLLHEWTLGRMEKLSRQPADASERGQASGTDHSGRARLAQAVGPEGDRDFDRTRSDLHLMR